MRDENERYASDISRAHFDRQQLQGSSHLEYNEQLRAQVVRLEQQLHDQANEYACERQRLQDEARLATTSASTSHVVEVAQSHQLERTGNALRIVQRERDAAEGALAHCQQRAQALIDRAKGETEEQRATAERALGQANAESAQLREELARRTAEWERSRLRTEEELLQAREQVEALEGELGQVVAQFDKKEVGYMSELSQLSTALKTEATKCGELELKCADLVNL